jgi:hypothetical protein
VDLEGVHQRTLDVVVAQHVAVPVEGEALPDGDDAVVVEGVPHNEQERQVEEREDNV